MQAVILSIGDELVLGQTVDTNSAYLSSKLAERGIETRYHQTIADEQSVIAEAIVHASKLAPLMIITGGLGPTDDDLTRQALAEAMEVDLVEDPASMAAIRTMMERFGRKMADRNRVQALHPRGTAMIPNSCGTAPGIEAKLNIAAIYVMPGVPNEMVQMYARSIEPQLQTVSRVILTSKINTFGNGESNVAEMLGDLCDRHRNPLVGTTVSEGIVSVRVRSVFDDANVAREQLNQTIDEVEKALGAIVFGREGDTLQQAVIRLLRKQQRTVAAAESCTGGLINKMLTDIPGSSAAVIGGWVTYTNDMKRQQLGVTEESLAQHGAVSAQAASQMAQGALGNSEADIAIGLTGIAGPDGGSDEKPVGTIWIALAAKDMLEPVVRRFVLPGTRENVRDRAAKCALQMIRLHLMGQPLELIRWGSRG